MNLIKTFRIYKTITQTLILITTLFSVSQIHADVSITVEKGLIDSNYSGKVYVIIAPVSKALMPLKTNYWFRPIEVISKEVSYEMQV